MRKLLKQYPPTVQIKAATAAAQRAKLLDRRAAEAAVGRTREAEERLVSILEYDAADALKKDLLGNVAPLMRPDSVRFFHRALLSAQTELDAAAACFGDEERALATKFAAQAAVRTATEPGGDDDALARLPPRPFGRAALGGYASASEREAAVARAIAGLPAPPAALNRGDLQNQLNNEYEASLKRGG